MMLRPSSELEALIWREALSGPLSLSSSVKSLMLKRRMRLSLVVTRRLYLSFIVPETGLLTGRDESDPLAREWTKAIPVTFAPPAPVPPTDPPPAPCLRVPLLLLREQAIWV
jgi:hypothetical protein